MPTTVVLPAYNRDVLVPFRVGALYRQRGFVQNTPELQEMFTQATQILLDLCRQVEGGTHTLEMKAYTTVEMCYRAMKQLNTVSKVSMQMVRFANELIKGKVKH